MMALLPPWALATALLTLTQAPATKPKAPSEGPTPPTNSLSDETEPEVAEFANPLTEAFQPVAGGLTAEVIASKATEASLDVAIAEADIAKAAAQLDQTMINFIPSVSVSASYTRLSYAEANFGSDDEMADGGFIVGAATEGPIVVGPCPGGMGQCVVDSAGLPIGAAPFDTSAFAFEIPLNSFSLEAKLAVPISDYILSLVPARRGSIATRRAAELAHKASTIKAQTDAQLAYYNWLRSVAQVTVAADSLERSRARLVDAESALAAGVASKADVLRLDAVVARGEVFVAEAQAFKALSEQNLRVMLNDPDLRFTVGEDVWAMPSDIPRSQNLDKLVREAHENRLELKSVQQNSKAVHEGIKATRAQYFPRLDGFANATYANPNQRFFPATNEWNGSWAIGVQLSYSINQAAQASAKIREYKATRRTVDLNAEKLKRGITLEVTQAFLDRKKAMTNIVLNERAAQASEEGYRVATDLFRLVRQPRPISFRRSPSGCRRACKTSMPGSIFGSPMPASNMRLAG